jgi:hypothetical protein
MLDRQRSNGAIGREASSLIASKPCTLAWQSAQSGAVAKAPSTTSRVAASGGRVGGNVGGDVGGLVGGDVGGDVGGEVSGGLPSEVSIVSPAHPELTRQTKATAFKTPMKRGTDMVLDGGPWVRSPSDASATNSQ